MKGQTEEMLLFVELSWFKTLCIKTIEFYPENNNVRKSVEDYLPHCSTGFEMGLYMELWTDKMFIANEQKSDCALIQFLQAPGAWCL